MDSIAAGAVISRVTDEVMGEMTAWKTRPMQPMWPVVFFDALRVKIREEDAVVRSKPVYLALGVLPDGTRQVYERVLGDQRASAWPELLVREVAPGGGPSARAALMAASNCSNVPQN